MNNYHISLEDSIFEHRNKAYGAYVLRTAYAANMTKAMFLTIGGVFTFFIAVEHFTKIGKQLNPEVMIETILTDEANIEKAKIIKPDLPKPKPPVNTASAPLLQKTIANIEVAVVKDNTPVIENLPPKDEDLVNAVGSTTTKAGLEVGSGNALGNNGTKHNGKDTAIDLPVDNTSTKIWTYAAEMPAFPDGEAALYKFLNSNLLYPVIAKENDIKGTVTLQFVVTTLGKIEKIKVLRGIGGGCDEEAIRVVKAMPDWKPGKHQGRAVPVKFTLPIKFSLK